MAVYRIYFVHADGRLDAGESFHCASDAEAIERFDPATRPGVRAELWQGGRWLAVAGWAQRKAS